MVGQVVILDLGGDLSHTRVGVHKERVDVALLLLLEPIDYQLEFVVQERVQVSLEQATHETQEVQMQLESVLGGHLEHALPNVKLAELLGAVFQGAQLEHLEHVVEEGVSERGVVCRTEEFQHSPMEVRGAPGILLERRRVPLQRQDGAGPLLLTLLSVDLHESLE